MNARVPRGRRPGEQTGQRGKLEPGVNVGTEAGRRKPDEYLCEQA